MQGNLEEVAASAESNGFQAEQSELMPMVQVDGQRLGADYQLDR